MADARSGGGQAAMEETAGSAVAASLGYRLWRLTDAPVRRNVNQQQQPEAVLKRWMSWARRSRLEPFKKLAATLRDRLAGVVRGNAYVEAMNGMLQQVKRAACGFRTVKNFVASPTVACPS
jgi:transposase